MTGIVVDNLGAFEVDPEQGYVWQTGKSANDFKMSQVEKIIRTVKRELPDVRPPEGEWYLVDDENAE